MFSNDHRQGVSQVIIFTDCQEAMSRVDGLRHISPTDQWLRGDPILRKLVARSQYFCGVGVEVEIRWVPGHSGVEGNVHADAAARSAAWRCPGIAEGVYLDEGLRIIELQLTGQDGVHGQQDSLSYPGINDRCHWCSCQR
ncbi:hypothetical protein F5883DRAFT_440660 [Diaporthe sp. PMI_573]|nr:hypothetical protein F5883DRAFT_440660 [Diaporthaceae sp. PMI_573]